MCSEMCITDASFGVMHEKFARHRRLPPEVAFSRAAEEPVQVAPEGSAALHLEMPPGTAVLDRVPFGP